MSIISGTVGAILGSEAQNNATKQNAQNVANTNAQNYSMWQQSRGSGGSAVLPTYLRTANGQLFEPQIGQDLVSGYEATEQNPQDALAEYGGVAGQMQPATQGALNAVSGVFNGQNQKQQLANVAPVQAARVNMTRQSAMDALNKTLGEINAQQAAKGYTGDSMGNRLLAFNANEQAGNAVAGANIQNLSETAGIKNAALQAQVQDSSMPFNMASSAENFANLPEDTYLNQEVAQQQPLKFLYTGPGTAFQNQNLPTVNPIASPAQLAMQGVSGAGNTALNYWMTKNLLSNYGASGSGTPALGDYGGFASTAGMTVPEGYSALDPSISGAALSFGE